MNLRQRVSRYGSGVMFTAGVAKGYGDEDIAAAIKTFEEYAGVVVKRKKA